MDPKTRRLDLLIEKQKLEITKHELSKDLTSSEIQRKELEIGLKEKKLELLELGNENSDELIELNKQEIELDKQELQLLKEEVSLHDRSLGTRNAELDILLRERRTLAEKGSE